MIKSSCKILVSLLFVNITGTALAQCQNGDFESAGFKYWKPYTGKCCPASANLFGIVYGRHTIMSGPAMDMQTNSQVPVVYPGEGIYSARLGNEETGAKAEKLEYELKVTEENALFSYRYAVVLQAAANHPPDVQSRFSVRVTDQLGNLIPCGQLAYIASPGLPGFTEADPSLPEDTILHKGGVIFKNWSTEIIDLRAYIGQLVTIEFMTGDCEWGGHFGYAYLDGVCEKVNIDGSSFCPGTNALTLSAPSGFADYLWSTGESTSSITVNNPVAGTGYSVTITPSAGGSCAITLFDTLREISIDPHFTYNGNCLGSEVEFRDSTSVTKGAELSWLWDFGDGTTSILQHPKHKFNAAGTYSVTLTVTAQGGCFSSVARDITLEKPMEMPDPQCVLSTLTSIEVRWTSVEGAMQGYEVSETDGQTWMIWTDTTYTISGLNAGEKISFFVRALGSPPCGNTSTAGIQCYTLPCPKTVLTVVPDTTINWGDTVLVHAQADSGAGPYSYTWKPNIGTGPGPFMQVPKSSTTYSVTVSDLGAPGCKVKKDIKIKVLPPPPPPECQYYCYVPSAFTPDGDGLNEEFSIQSDCIQQFDMKIYNRWGQLAFHSQDVSKAWNGKKENEGSLSPAGVYIYLLSLRDQKGQEYRQNGTVSLIRK